MTRRMKILIAAGLLAATGAVGAAGIAQAKDWRGEGCDFHRGGHHMDGRDGGGHMEGRHGGWRHGGPGGKGRHAMALMERFDGNGDGALTQDEIDQARAANLAKFDADGNGQLSLGEFEALWLDFMRERMVDRFQDLDADGDASVSADEFARPFTKLVERMDRNDDGKLSREDRPERGHERRGGDDND